MNTLMKALAAILLGVPVGLAAFTVQHAGGLSYLSTDPKSCANCHIMGNQYDSWQKSSHHAVATCVDCHLPASGLDKYWAKVENGYHHSKAFTLQDFHEPIMIGERNSKILQENCLRCHGSLFHSASPTGTDNGSEDGSMRCVHCHRASGHGQWLGLGGPDRGESAEKK